MDGDYVSGLLAGTTGLDFGMPGLNAGFFETLCGAMFGDRATGMHGFGNGGGLGPEGAVGASPPGRAPRLRPSVCTNAKKRSALGAAMGKEAATTFAKMGEAMGPDSKKCKIEDETVRPKVEEEAATARRSAKERGQGDKGKGSKSKQPGGQPLGDYAHVRLGEARPTN
ncbi:hypothetical protein ZWY2020_029565 [Hordeum vulgare]|nr:hypothetical protein ZWY2020_029565 [Hordeum vulgare]